MFDFETSLFGQTQVYLRSVEFIIFVGTLNVLDLMIVNIRTATGKLPLEGRAADQYAMVVITVVLFIAVVISQNIWFL